MTAAELVAAALFTGVVAYAVFGGADFGSGFYDLTAGGGPGGSRVRTLIDHSIGPVWEANHVWLIYVLVVWWTGFPKAFAAAMTTLFTPLVLALAGIVLRGSTFAFRKYAETFAQARLFGAVFAGSSLITPFFLGTVAGAIASGRVPAAGYGDPVRSWLNPTSLVGGCLAAATSVFLAGVFLTVAAARTSTPELAARLRVRALSVGAVTGVIVAAGLYPVSRDAPTLAAGLRGRALPLLLIAAVAGATTMVLLYRRKALGAARVSAVTAVVAVVAGWGVAQYPWMLVDHQRIGDAAGAPATLDALLIVVVLAGLLVIPPLGYLLWFSQSEKPPSARGGD
ncbi:cytochrome d ubiquinol oxidase subunit II [Mycobacterium paraterrae]|uniref:Cytochrome d ubiquinol oxidase subunit II n=1 Tax=Mycobacterium paraterrae TaxID=577492 RepID=A0ABY3VJC1_9MYCO|nr:cytochrome d ubiquinol oxidase subunit II [Mycobacterium paraterrae]UMB69492.1 cytochrome d ubiquinol oxidase subunit II [Mycobacterium paraterrae]